MQAILVAAARVFAVHGYAAGTTNRIAEEAGVSVGSLYEYFPNKDAILAALMEAHVAEGQRILEGAGAGALAEGTSLRDAVRHMTRAMIDLHARDRALHRVLFEEVPLPRQVRRQLEEVERRITERVADHLRRHPEVTAPDADVAAAVVVQAIEGLTHKLVVHGDRDDALPVYVEELVTLATAYLTAPRGAR